MTLTDDEAAAMAADALQAEVFRRSLCDARAHLDAEISKRRGDIARASDKLTVFRLQAHQRRAEAELNYVDGLIARLDRRFSNDRASN